MTLRDFMNLFPEFRASSWDGWRTQLARLSPQTREFYAIVGRGAGKSRIVALIACWFASREYRRVPGEFIYCGIFAPDRKQAGVTFRYIRGLLRSVDALARLIENETRGSIQLSTGVVIEVITATIAAPRGRAYALAIVEEAAFLPQDESAHPDQELLRALRPALARVPGSLLAVVSSPYARKGVIWTASQKYQDQPDGDVVLVRAPTLELNPTFDALAVAKAYEEDPQSAAAEFGAQFRSDVESFISHEAIKALVIPDRRELPPDSELEYCAFTDPSGGSSDSFTLAIAHMESHEGHEFNVLDAVREVRPPFSPEQTVKDLAALLDSYHVSQVTGDRYAGQWPREQFRKHGIEYVVSDRVKSDIYRDSLPIINSGRVELLDHPRLIAQLTGLERRTSRGGRDSIDHAPGGGAKDDVANAACGAIVLAATEQYRTLQLREVRWG